VSEGSSGSFSVGDIFGDLRLRDYLKIAQRRRWWIILTAGGMCLAAVIFSMRLPSAYRSQTTILVDPQKVPDSYVPTTVTSTIGDRLGTLTQQIMSPNLLRRTRTELHLYPDAYGPDEPVIKKMQKSLSVETISGTHQINAFQVAYTDQDPEVAAKVANALATDLIRENLKVREEQFSGTADFLENELHDTKQQLEQKETELASIKSKYVMDLPESQQFHLQALSNLRLQLQASEDRVNRAQQEKVYLQSLMVSSHPTVDLDTGDGGGRTSSESVQIQKLETRLSELRARYGPSFPDVRKVEAELGALRAKAEEEEKDQPSAVQVPPTSGGKVRNPVLEAQISKLDQEIKEQTNLQPGLQQQIDFHASKLEREPVFQQQISGLMRDYDALRTHYDRLLDKKLSAEMASDLESHQRGESFVVLDRATPPLHPSSPNRPLICFAGLVIGALGGLALAFALELTSDSVRDEREVVQIFRSPVLAGIPYVLSPKQLRRNRIRLLGASIGVAAAAAIFGFVASYLFQGLV
jgi:succinoglycan biosynthesis transport protein ExoP